MSTWKNIRKNVHLNGMFAASLAVPDKQNATKGGQKPEENTSTDHSDKYKTNYATLFASSLATDTLSDKYGKAYTTFSSPDSLENRYSFRKQDNDKALYNNFVNEHREDNGKHSDDRKQPGKVTDLLKDFCSETSAHGLPHIVKDKGWSPWSIVWFILFLGAMFGEFYHLSRLIEQYVQYPSVDSFKVSDEGTCIALMFKHIILF